MSGAREDAEDVWDRPGVPSAVRLVNRTPHPFVLYDRAGRTVLLVVPPSGTVARCATRREEVGSLHVAGHEVPLTRVRMGTVTGLPEPRPGVAHLVSRTVAERLPERSDLMMADDTVRDATGAIIGARALSLAHHRPAP